MLSDVISFIMHFILWYQNKFCSNPALALAGFEFLNLARSGSGWIWNCQTRYNSPSMCEWSLCSVLMVDVISLHSCLINTTVPVNPLQNRCRNFDTISKIPHSIPQVVWLCNSNSIMCCVVVFCSCIMLLCIELKLVSRRDETYLKPSVVVLCTV